MALPVVGHHARGMRGAVTGPVSASDSCGTVRVLVSRAERSTELVVAVANLLVLEIVPDLGNVALVTMRQQALGGAAGKGSQLAPSLNDAKEDRAFARRLVGHQPQR